MYLVTMGPSRWSGGHFRALMPERGGPTAQSGILFQNSVTTLYLGRLCDETDRPSGSRVVRVRVETPDDVDDTAIWFDDGRVEYVQAKERLTRSDAAWGKLWRAFAAQYDRDSFIKRRDRLCLHVSEGLLDHRHVDELCHRARTHEDTREWLAALSAEQTSTMWAIAPLLAPTLSVSDEVLHAFFAHVYVRLWPLSQIEDDWVPNWMPPASVSAHTLFALLRDQVGGAARVRAQFTAAALRRRLLDAHGVTFEVAPDAEALRSAVHACSALLRQHKASIGQTGLHLPRSVVHEIADWALDRSVDCRVGMLLDHAGRGKTVVMQDVLTELEARGATVLAIKADQQLSGVRDVQTLHERLLLPESVVRVTSRLAAGAPMVLIVDQLDALSLSLARDQQALNAVLEMVARVRMIPGVTVLLSCRTFDRHTDPRLKQVDVGREFLLPPFTEAEVVSVLAQMGVDPESLSRATRELLRTPLHLDLFARLAAMPDRERARLRGLQSLQDLYSLLWDEVVLQPHVTGPSPLARERVVRAMTARMQDDQRTSVPRSLMVALSDPDAVSAADALASAGLLIRTPIEWTFLHQSFFDYCYARFFVEDGKNLAETVLTSDQGLFARPQVVQVLAYLRAYSHSDYIRTLHALLAATGLRYHLRDLVLRWVGALADPTDAEWRLVHGLLMHPSTRVHAMRAITGQSTWFGRLADAVLDELLRGDFAFVDNQVVPYLASIVDSGVQGEIVRVVRPWLDAEDPWPARARYVGQQIRSWRSADAVALFEDVVSRSPLESVQYLFELDDIANADPVAGCRILLTLLDRVLAAYSAQPTGDPRAFRGMGGNLDILNGSSVQKTLETVNRLAPAAFVDAMVPWLERALTADDGNARWSSDYYYPPDAITVGGVNADTVGRHALLQGYVNALVALARAKHPVFVRWSERLASLPYTTPQLILTRVYRELGPSYALDALRYITGDARRLRFGQNDAFESRMLVRAVATHLQLSDLATLERFVLSETGRIHRWHDRRAALRWRGVDQLHLLRELPSDRLSAAGRTRLQELERKFPGEFATDSPTTMRGGFVGSPIPADACARMSDAAWLGAMRQYAHGVEHEDFLRGGAMQLARVLADHIKLAPARYANLAARLPDDGDDNYVIAFLDGLSASSAPPEWLYALVRRFAVRARSTVHRSAAWALDKMVSRGEQLPVDLLELLELWVREPPRDDEAFYESQDNFTDGILNTDRGAALHALMHALISEDSDAAVARRWAIMEFVSRDPSTVLRAGCLDFLSHLLRADKNRAIALFEATVRGHARLRSASPYAEFLYYASCGNFRRLAPYVKDLMHAESVSARQRGAEIAVLGLLASAGLEDDEARALAKQLTHEAVTGPAEWRRGAARIYAHNWADDSTAECKTGLQLFFDDPDSDVCREAAGMMDQLRPEHMQTRHDFLVAFAASGAGRLGRHKFAEYLWKHGMLAVAWSLSTVEVLLDNHGVDDQDHWLGGGEDLVRLVLRVYTDPSADTALRERAIAVFDRLVEQFAGYAQAALAEWDRS